MTLWLLCCRGQLGTSALPGPRRVAQRPRGEGGRREGAEPRAAALHAAGRAGARELVTKYEKKHGRLPAESRQRARQFLTAAGLLDDEPQQAAS